MFSSLITAAINLLHAPLRHLYKNGPGPIFWQGQDESIICSQLTGTKPVFWLANEEQCTEIVDDRFTQYILVLQTALAYYVGYVLIMQTTKFTLYRISSLSIWNRNPDNDRKLSYLHRPIGFVDSPCRHSAIYTYDIVPYLHIQHHKSVPQIKVPYSHKTCGYQKTSIH